jgi:PAP2 superfamily protein
MRNLETDLQRKRCCGDGYELTRADTRVTPFAGCALRVFAFSLLLLGGSGWALAHEGADEFAREVADWTRITVQATLTPPVTSPPVSTRTAAMVQAAVFDAVNGIERRYTPIFVRQPGPRHASKRGAVVQAAYGILIRLYPAQADMLSQQRSASLMGISRGWGAESSEEIERGVAWGQAVADAIWALRSNDGLNATPPPFTGGTAPGEWRPIPPSTGGLVPQLAHVVPWVIQSPSQFRPPAPPALDSAQYATDFNETKLKGSSSSTARTPEETAYALFWAPGNPPDYWNPVAISLAAEHHYSLLRTARLLAHLNLAMSDAIIGCWDAKYTYVAWRPITAIHLADTDGNPDTAADPNWNPLIPTPGHPEYPSSHSCATAAAAYVLTHYFGDATAISITTDTLPGQMRTYPSISAAVEEVINARVFGGIHFRTSCETGQSLGTAVGDYVVKHSLRRIDDCHWCGREHDKDD